MKKKITKLIIRLYQLIKKNIEKFIILGIVHGVSVYLLHLPYINLLNIILSDIPFILDWIVIIVLFKPKKDLILKIALMLLVISFFPEFLHFQKISEILGEASYIFIATYILLSLKEY